MHVVRAQDRRLDVDVPGRGRSKRVGRARGFDGSLRTSDRKLKEEDTLGSRCGLHKEQDRWQRLTRGRCTAQSFLLLVVDHGEHFGYCVAYTLGNAVTARVIRTRGEFADTKEVINDGGNCARKWEPLLERRVDGQPQRGINLFTSILTVFPAVNPAAVTAIMSALRLQRSVKRRMYEFSRAVVGRGPK